ncbi:unnamed protein product [Knipowitschia caucasica]
MKSFERLVLSHLKSLTSPLLDPLQFAYRANRSVDDAINLALHHILQHLDSPGTYARVLFVDFSSAFNTILPSLLQDKLSQLNVPDSTCRWITDFLTDRKQRVRLGKNVSDSRIINPGAPQGCVFSPLLFSLYTNHCTSSHDSVKLIKFADYTTLIGLISNNDESAYRREVDRRVSWCSGNNLELNAQKTVEMIVDCERPEDSGDDCHTSCLMPSLRSRRAPRKPSPRLPAKAARRGEIRVKGAEAGAPRHSISSKAMSIMISFVNEGDLLPRELAKRV